MKSRVFSFRVCHSYLFLYRHVFLYNFFYYFFKQVNVGWKVTKVVLDIDNSFGVWRDCLEKAQNECINVLDEWSRVMKQIRICWKLPHGSGQLWTTFYENFSSNTIIMSNDLIRHLVSIIDSLLVAKILLPNQTILLLY